MPDYLSQVPIDPYSGRPLIYRRTAEGYLLYSVGSNRVDDGGQRTNISQAAVEGVGDYFFDAPQLEDATEPGSDGAASNDAVESNNPDQPASP